jgi:hypothetical protein
VAGRAAGFAVGAGVAVGAGGAATTGGVVAVGTGVLVGFLVGFGVFVGTAGTGVLVGGTGVLVGTGVFVGGTGVLVGTGNGVFVGGTGVLVGGTGVLVAVGIGVLVGTGVFTTITGMTGTTVMPGPGMFTCAEGEPGSVGLGEVRCTVFGYEAGPFTAAKLTVKVQLAEPPAGIAGSEHSTVCPEVEQLLVPHTGMAEAGKPSNARLSEIREVALVEPPVFVTMMV